MIPATSTVRSPSCSRRSRSRPPPAQPFVDESDTYVDIAGDHAKGADVLTRGLAVAVMPGDVNFMYYRLAYSLWQTNNREAALACYAFMLGMGFHAQYEEAAEVEVRELMQEMGVDSLPDMDAVTHTLNKHGIPVAPLTSQTELLAKGGDQTRSTPLPARRRRGGVGAWRVEQRRPTGCTAPELAFRCARRGCRARLRASRQLIPNLRPFPA